MNCPYCGFELLEGAAFCTRCGAVMPDKTGSASYGYTGYAGSRAGTDAFDTGRQSVVPDLDLPEAEDVGPQPAEAPRKPAAAPVPGRSDTQRPAPVPQTSGAHRRAPQPAPDPGRDAGAASGQRSGGVKREPVRSRTVYGAAPVRDPEDAECTSIRQYSGSPQFRPLSAWKYFWLSLLYAIPAVGLVFLIIHSFTRSNLVRRSYARSWFCRMLAGVIVLIALFAVLLALGMFREGRMAEFWHNLVMSLAGTGGVQ